MSARSHLLALFAATLSAGAGIAPPGPAAAALAQRLDGQLTDLGFAGTVLVRHGEATVLHRAYGALDRAGRRPATTDTAFYCASVAKNFTAAAVLALEEDGLLRRTDRLADHVDGVPDDRAGITIHQLLTHTSGIGQNYAADGMADRHAALQAILAEPLEAEPGTEFHYGNDNYTLLSILVEVVSGRELARFLNERLFAPAGMRSTSFWGQPPPAGSVRAELAADYPEDIARPNWGWKGPTGIATTTGDLLRWWTALRSGTVLDPTTVEALWRPEISLTDGWAANGWFRTPIPGRTEDALWTRGRDSSGESGILLWLPRFEILIIALSHQGQLGDLPAAHRAAYAVAEIMLPTSP